MAVIENEPYRVVPDGVYPGNDHAFLARLQSLLPGAVEHLNEDGTLLCDNRARTCPAAYRLSRTDHCVEGDSPIVELPTWGLLSDAQDLEIMLSIARESLTSGRSMAELWERDRRNRGDFTGLASSGSHDPDRPEIVQVFFHYWNFIDDLLHSDGSFDRLKTFLTQWSSLDDCDYATATEAAKLWSNQT